MPEDDVPIEVETGNGEAPERTRGDGWVIAVAHGMRFVGKLSRGILSPVYELQVQMGPDGKGGLVIGHTSLPICLLPSWKAVALPNGALIQNVDELSRSDRDVVFRAIASGEQMAGGLRTSQSGIVQASSVPKGAGLPGLRRR